MMFSLLMSLYKNENHLFLEKCLHSIENQRVKASEVVLIFDGPLTDELVTTVDKWKSRLPLVIVPLEKNVGLGNALNIGLRHCQHEWVFRMDTDDICEPDRFEKQVSFISNNPDIDLFGTQVREFSNDSEDLNEKRVPLDHAAIFEYAKKRNPFNHMTVAYRKSAVLAAGGYQHHLYMEDYNLWLRMLAQGAKMANMPESLVLVRAGNDMYRRRRGGVYIKSEWQLARLKIRLKIQSAVSAYACFILRSAPRLLPSGFLALIYKFLRKTKHNMG